jgi:hypothetical protein
MKARDAEFAMHSVHSDIQTMRGKRCKAEERRPNRIEEIVYWNAQIDARDKDLIVCYDKWIAAQAAAHTAKADIALATAIAAAAAATRRIQSLPSAPASVFS